MDGWESFYFLGEAKKSYPEIWDFQKKRVQEIAENRAKEAVIFCEHEALITAGRRYHEENILDDSLPLYFVERGGDVTWHGPGQLVIYPLFRLQGGLFPSGLHEYLRFCEEVVIQVLSTYGLDVGRYGETGVWLRRKNEKIKKIASIGVAVRRWITYHGISINVSSSLENFQHIRPCNFDADIMTSLAEEGINKSLQELSGEIGQKMEDLLLNKGQPQSLAYQKA